MKKLTFITVIIGGLAATGAVLAQGGHGGNFRGGLPSFASTDANGDGVITEAEMRARGSERFGQFDTNGDGLATAEEMIGAATALINRQISRLDKNGDGMLSAEEMRPRRADEAFSNADTDGDGTLSEAEYNAIMPGR